LGLYLFAIASRQILITQPPNHWVPRVPSPEVKRPQRETEHSHPSSSQVKHV